MTTTDPYAALREPLTGMPPVDPFGPTLHEPAAVDRIPNVEPERVVYVPGPGGRMVPVLADHYQPPAPAGVAEPPLAAERDKWPLRMVTGGGSTAMVLGVVGHYGHGINQAGHGAMMAGIAVAATAGGVGLLVGIVKGGLSKQAKVEVTLNLTNNVSSSSRSNSRSRSK